LTRLSGLQPLILLIFSPLMPLIAYGMPQTMAKILSLAFSILACGQKAQASMTRVCLLEFHLSGKDHVREEMILIPPWPV
jgi:hypothetical protein